MAVRRRVGDVPLGSAFIRGHVLAGERERGCGKAQPQMLVCEVGGSMHLLLHVAAWSKRSHPPLCTISNSMFLVISNHVQNQFLHIKRYDLYCCFFAKLQHYKYLHSLNFSIFLKSC